MTREEQDAIIGRAYQDKKDALREITELRKKCAQVGKKLVPYVHALLPDEKENVFLRDPDNPRKDPDFSGLSILDYPSRKDIEQLKNQYWKAKEKIESAQSILDECE